MRQKFVRFLSFFCCYLCFRNLVLPVFPAVSPIFRLFNNWILIFPPASPDRWLIINVMQNKCLGCHCLRRQWKGGKLSGGNYVKAIYTESIFQGPSDNSLGLIISGEFFQGAIVWAPIFWVVIVRGAIILGGFVQGAIILGGNCPGDNCPVPVFDS